MNQELKDFIYKNKALFWYTPEAGLYRISDELLVETILNYGSLESIKELFSIIGISRASSTFRGLIGRKKGNYFPEVYNFFNIVFDRYVPKHS
jgi:hypothetical protein